jgi:putative aldouronate transport system substrate-binding protein
MKKVARKSLSILLAGGLLLSALTGCSNGGGATASTASTSSTSESFNETGLPITKEPTTIKVVTMRWGDMGDTFKNNKWLQDLEKQTNVKVDWQVKSSNDWDEQKPLLLSSGNLPDVIFGDGTFNNSDIVNNLDYFIPLDSYIEKYMPNLKKAMEDYPTLKKISTFPDGKIYSLPARLPSRPYSCDQLVINKSWLTKLGLKEPTTIDELENVLKAFKDQDPNGNGKKDEIPYTTNAANGLDVNFMSPFGVTDLNNTLMMIQNDKPVFWPTSDEYKAAIKWVHKLYSEGLIDPEIFTQDDTKTSGKYQSADAATVGISYQWSADAVFGKWSDQYEVIAPLAGPDGKRYQGGDPETQSYRRNELEITTACKCPEVVARWADQWYTGEASIQNFWGALGEVTQKNDDGTYSLLTPPEGTSADSWYWSSSLRDFGPKFVSDEFNKKINLPKDSGDGLKLVIDALGKDYVTKPFPDLMYKTEEFSSLATLTTDLRSYIDLMQAQWVTKGGVDEQWDTYVSKLKEMGLDQFIQIRTDAYARYTNS